MANYDTYAIVDVTNWQSGTITFLRYQTFPQGNVFYHNPNGTDVHEVCCQRNATPLTYIPGQNVYNDFYTNGYFPHGEISVSRTNPYTYLTNPGMKPVIMNPANANYIVTAGMILQQRDFTFREKYCRFGRSWRILYGGNYGPKLKFGAYELWEKPVGSGLNINIHTMLHRYTPDDHHYKKARTLLDMTIFYFNPGNGLKYLFHNPNTSNVNRFNIRTAGEYANIIYNYA